MVALNDGWGHIWFPVTAVQAMCVCLYYNTSPCSTTVIQIHLMFCTTIQSPVGNQLVLCTTIKAHVVPLYKYIRPPLTVINADESFATATSTA